MYQLMGYSLTPVGLPSPTSLPEQSSEIFAYGVDGMSLMMDTLIRRELCSVTALS